MPEIDPLLQQQCSARVSEHVRSDFPQIQQCCVPVKNVADRLFSQTSP